MAESEGLGGRRRTGRATGLPQDSARLSALQELLNLKRNGGKRVDSFEVRLEEKVYDTLSEADYDRHVAKRREEAAEFVVDDDGLGYVDGADEDDWNSGKSDGDDDDGAKNAGKQKKLQENKKKDRPSKTAAELAAAAVLTGKRRVTSMFAEASVNAFGRRARDKPIGAGRIGASTESILDDVLAGIMADDVDREREKRRRRELRTRENSSNMFAEIQQPTVQFDPRLLQIQDPQARPSRSSQGKVLHPQQEIPESPVHETQEFIPDEGNNVDASDPGTKEEAVVSSEAVPLPAVQGSPTHESGPVTAEFTEEAPLEPSSGERLELKPGLNAKIVENRQTGAEASAAWHSIVEGGAHKSVANEAMKEAVREENPESDSNALPIDTDGNLPFYLFDAYEEEFGSNPGTIYLFGKVPTAVKGNYVSCCVVVRNLQRCIFAVPSPSIFSDNSLAELEEAAKSGGDAEKWALKSKLQELATEMKTELAEKLMDQNVGRFTMVPVKRSYAFDRADVPTGEHYFMKLNYPFKDTPLPSDLQGRYFTSLFGTHTSALEIFLIKRKIKGPCWLSISKPMRCPSSSQVSWCKLEINLESPKDIIVCPAGKGPAEIPQLVVAALNLKTVINHKDNINEIASASVVYHRRVKVDMPMPLAEWNTHEMLSHFSIVRKLEGGVFPSGFASEVDQINSKMGATVLAYESSERALLSLLMVKLYQLDPDVLVGHNISGFDLDVLLHRLQACKVQSKIWSKIGRLRRSQMPRLTGGGNTFGSGAGPGHMACIAGRLLCDTYLSSRELLKETSYSLTELSRTRLGRERKELVPSEIPNMYQSSSTLIELIESGETDAWLALGLMFHLSVLPLTRQLTNISGNLWSRTLQGSRAQRVEYLLLHEFHGRKFILPDKLSFRDKERLTNKRKPGSHQVLGDEADEMLMDDEDGNGDGPQNAASKRKKGAAYLGGLVLEPKKGLYDKFILLLDFNSLYPSIIQEYNVCFTTVDKPSDGSIPRLPSTALPGVLPQVLKGLVDRRKQVKLWLKRTTDSLKYQQFDIQQQALKLTANSIYGCLGFTNARFYAKPIAELITSQGREILQSTVDLVKDNLNLEVIYGDTDSIMIHTGLEDLNAARAIGVKVIKEVNKKYRLLEIDMDGIYKRMLLLKKKKYAAVKIEVNSDGTIREVIEQKGLDIVRRDWSLLSKDIGNFVLKQILSGGSREDVVEAIHNELRQLQGDLRNGQVDLDKFTINKTLTKPPEDYPDAKNQPHVQVALRRRQTGHRVGCAAGDTVPYIICVERGTTGASLSSLAERARHPDELKTNNENWIVDIEYYISQQIRPVVTRLCAPIEGTDAAHIADCLGLDPSKFQQAQASSDQDEAILTSAPILDDDDRYRHCEPLELVCPQCTKLYQFSGVSHILAERPAEGAESNGTNHSIVSDELLRCPDCTRDGCSQKLSPGMLANQVKQRADEFITRYYEGIMCCDEDSCGHITRNVSLRVVGDAERGTVCPNYPRCNGRLGRQYTEVDLYKQLTHFYRLLDTSRALDKIAERSVRLAAEVKLATVRPALETAAQVIKDVRDRSGFRWVNLGALCVSIS
ncbi:unnamed protein product [Calypogeia fissa]